LGKALHYALWGAALAGIGCLGLLAGLLRRGLALGSESAAGPRDGLSEEDERRLREELSRI
jgi:hypothetical protein